MLDIDKIQMELIINSDPARKEIYKLRETTKELEKEMKKIPKDTEEWNKKFDELKAANRRIEEINKTIGLTGMTSKELRNRLREVKNMMDQFGQNTPQWKELNSEMKSIVARQKELGTGAVKTHGSMMTLMGGVKSLLPTLGLGAGLAGAFNFLKGVINSTDTLADKFEATMGGLKEAFTFLKQTLATLDFSNLITGFRDAYKAGKQYAEALDLIGDLQRSIGIQKIDIEMEISKQRAIAKNRSLDIKDREAALNKIIELEKKKMTIVQEVTDFELAETAKLILSRDKSGKVTQEQLVDIISNYKEYNPIIEEGIALQKELDETSKSYYTNSRTGMGGWVQDSKVYKASYDALTDSQKEAIDIANIANLVADDQRDNFARTVSASKQAALELANSEEALVRLQNSLRSELLKEEDDEGGGGGLGKKGDPEFDKWKAEQDKLFIKKNEYIISKIEEQAIILGEAHQASLEEFGDPLGIPSEETVEDEMTYLMEKYQETVDGRLAINQAFFDADIISETEYNDRKKALMEEDAANHKAISDKKLSQAQVYMQGALQLTNALTNMNTAAMNRELKAAGDNAKKKEQIELEYAKKQKNIAYLQAIINTALAVTSAATTMPFMPLGLAMMIVAGIMGGLEIATIASTQFAEGNYADIIGEMDGKRYRAKVANSSHPSGLFSEPTYVPGFGLFGETKQPELVFNPADTQKLINSPGLINAINATIGGGRQYASGNTREIIKESRTETFTDPVMLEVMTQLRDEIQKGIRSYSVLNEDYIANHNKAMTEYNDFTTKVNG